MLFFYFCLCYIYYFRFLPFDLGSMLLSYIWAHSLHSYFLHIFRFLSLLLYLRQTDPSKPRLVCCCNNNNNTKKKKLSEGKICFKKNPRWYLVVIILVKHVNIFVVFLCLLSADSLKQTNML